MISTGWSVGSRLRAEAPTPQFIVIVANIGARILDETLAPTYIPAMKIEFWPPGGLAITLAKAFAVLVLAAALGGYAGPWAIDAHDNTLFWVGCACFLGAGLVLVIGGLWIAASVRALVGERKDWS
jgi:hypothetical protein